MTGTPTTAEPSATPLAPVRRGVPARMRRAVAAGLRRGPTRLLGTAAREHALCQLLVGDRLRLPRVPLADLDGGTRTPVTVPDMPRDNWDSNVGDAIAIARLVVSHGASRVLELGSHAGYTAALCAPHLPDRGTWVAVDMNPRHGWAYAGTPAAARIERRVGLIDEDLFDPDERFDVVFIDADHRYDAVARDTRVALSHLAQDGWLLWHDYANWGWFGGACQVPEFLHRLALDRLIVHLERTAIAVHRPIWRERPDTRPTVTRLGRAA